MEDTIYNRTEIILGKDNVDKLKTKHIMICGIGGVGSYCLEALSRIGVGIFTIIDKDRVDITNVNRQIIATMDTIGEDKVNIAKKRVELINKEAKVTALKLNLTKDNIEEILKDKSIDYVVDCVDNIEAKLAIILQCNKKNIKCISSMGMGNRLNPLDIKIDDIHNTKICPLARIMRKRLKEEGIKKQKVVYSVELPKKKTDEEKKLYSNTLGSVPFVPSVAGLVMASEVVKDIIYMN